MKRVLISVTLVAVLLAGTARADLEEGTYAPDLDAKDWMNSDRPISLSEMRGMAVVLYFWVSWHSAGEALMPLINQVENHPGLGRKGGVFVMGVTAADRGRVEEMIKENRIFFPVALECEAAEAYGITAFPRVVVIDPVGRVAYSGWPGGGGDDLAQALIDTFEKTPPFRTHPREARAAHRALDKSREALRAKDYRKAYFWARKAYDHALHGDPLKTRCADLLDLIESLGRDALAEGMHLLDEKKHSEGAVALREVVESYRITKAGKFARRYLRTLKNKSLDVRRALEGIDLESDARNKLASAAKLLWERSFGEAYETLKKIDKDYSETESAVQARAVLSRMEKNKEIMGYVRDHQAENKCEAMLAQARSFRETGQTSRAREILRRIIDDYPGTVYLEQAYDELEKLPN